MKTLRAFMAGLVVYLVLLFMIIAFSRLVLGFTGELASMMGGVAGVISWLAAMFVYIKVKNYEPKTPEVMAHNYDGEK